ncbi:MAG: histidine phosphatase family protein [Chloroflexota bacterium]
MTRLLLIRHGETDWNVEGRYQGQSDVPLSEAGRQQARRLAVELRDVPLSAIYSSDLARARETAQMVAEASGAPLRLDARLREVNQGEWEGRLFDDIRHDYADLLQRRRQDPLHVAPPGGETVLELRSRLIPAVEDIVQAHPRANVALVSHGLALAVIKASLNGVPIERVWDLIPGNAEVEWIEVEAG